MATGQTVVRFLASKHICLVMEIATGQNVLADGLFYNKN